jgi:hypothetical protein
LFILDQQHPILGSFVEAPVTDEVKDVVLSPPQPPLQGRQRSLFQPLQRHQPPLLQVTQGLLQFRPLLFYIERRVVAGARDHHQHPQGRLHRQRLDALRQLQVAHERGLYREDEEAIEGRVVEVLPGHVGQLGCIGQPQPDAQPCVLPVGLI